MLRWVFQYNVPGIGARLGMYTVPILSHSVFTTLRKVFIIPAGFDACFAYEKVSFAFVQNAESFGLINTCR